MDSIKFSKQKSGAGVLTVLLELLNPYRVTEDKRSPIHLVSQQLPCPHSPCPAKTHMTSD